MTNKFTESEMVDKTAVAKELFTYCTKEKIDTWHVVMNHDARGFVDKVLCKACKSEHKYRKTSVAAASPTKKSATVKKVVSPADRAKVVNSGSFEADWFKGIKVWGEKEVEGYDPKKHFALNHVLKHEVFGKGIVKSRRENKIDVLFQTGLKVLPSVSLALKDPPPGKKKYY